MVLADGAGLPLAITIASASPHETQLVAQTLNASFLPDNPERIIGDAAYDSDPLEDLSVLAEPKRIVLRGNVVG